MTDPAHVAALARAVLAGEFDACGVLADYLEERGDPRGVLLRKRWKRWRAERAGAKMRDEWAERDAKEPWLRMMQRLRELGATVGGDVSVSVTRYRDAVDSSLRRYVRERFPEAGEVRS